MKQDKTCVNGKTDTSQNLGFIFKTSTSLNNPEECIIINNNTQNKQ